MIELKGLRAIPPEYFSPLLTDEQITNILTDKIESVKSGVDKKFRLIGPVFPDQVLFVIKGGSETSVLRDDHNRLIGEALHEQIQRVGLEVMTVYGLDPEKFKVVEMQRRRLTQPNLDITIATRRYPTSTKGLAFERKVASITDTNEPIHITWSVWDEEPDIKLGNLLGIKISP